MNAPKHPLLDEAVRNFSIRNKPYDIQVGFMNDMLKCYDEEKIGFFESPTGTGKSLSVLCSSICFLRNKNAQFIKPKRTFGSDSESDSGPESSESDVDDFLEDENKPKPSKLIITTRTHSQIKEMVSELKNLIGSAKKSRADANQQIMIIEGRMRKGEKGLFEELQKHKHIVRSSKEYIDTFPHCVSLASRKQLCVNPEFKDLPQAELNEKCSTKCSFFNDGNLKQFKKQIRNEPMDIEDLCRYGSSHLLCPYYASRESISKSDIILIPYQTLFQSSTRENIDLSLDNAYIVVDEAHNLVDALNSLFTVTLTDANLEIACKKLLEYRAKIAKPEKTDKVLAESTTKTRNEDIKNISITFQALLSIRKACSEETTKQVLDMNDFQIKYKIRIGNTFSLINWAKDTKIVYKCCHAEKDEALKIESSEAIRKCLAFIDMMGNTDEMGSVIIENKTLSYLLLNPSNVFLEVASKAKSVVLVGGTLQPLDDIIFQLTQNQNPQSIMTHCNGHVIPKENCLCLCAMKGPKGSNPLFDYEHRELDSSIRSIADMVFDLSTRVPGGMIVFFTSKSYMMKVYTFIKNSQYHNKFPKLLLHEKSEESELALVMRTFKASIDANNGCILFAVINGKLSEGINFANDYCRCVVVVGMPYPDPNDVILKQRKLFFDQKAREGKTKCNGQMFYENLCMRAVNQSIGRSFRNINDYAVVVLFDQRYAKHSQNLPSWILRSYRNSQSWEEVDQMIDSFFARKKK